MPQNLGDWCRLAQTEQIEHGKGHLYANYRHSQALALISPTCFDGFERALGLIKPANSGLDHFEDASFGFAQVDVERAVAMFHAHPTCAGLADYRVSGKKFEWDDILINLRYRQKAVPVASSAGGARIPTKPTSARGSTPPMIWLTQVGRLFEALEAEFVRSGRAKLSETAFFQLMVRKLGLRPMNRGPVAECQLTVFRLKPGKKLARPHAFSVGYPERFCGVSPFGNFGATADNRTGRAGLPEAVALLSDLEQLPRTDPVVEAMVAEFDKVVDLSTLGRDALYSEQLVSDMHAQDDATAARKEILKRMRRVHPSVYCKDLRPDQRICSLRGTGHCK